MTWLAITLLLNYIQHEGASRQSSELYSVQGGCTPATLLAWPTSPLVCSGWGAVLVSRHNAPYFQVGYLTLNVDRPSQPNKHNISSQLFHDLANLFAIHLSRTSPHQPDCSCTCTCPLQVNIQHTKPHVPSHCLDHTKVSVNVQLLHYACLETRCVLTWKRCKHLAQTHSCITTHYRLTAFVY
jgi:hypothetical protein